MLWLMEKSVNKKRYKNTWEHLKIAIGQGNHYTTGWVLNYPYVKEN